MKNFLKHILLTILTAFYAISVCFGDNPIVQIIYTADPAPMVYNGRVYVYTGHNEDGSTNYTMKDWRVYSSSDMVNWEDHGSPLAYTTFSWASGNAWAGQCIYRNGKFYYYVPIQSTSLGRMAIGVAVSNSPTGPFTDAIGKPLIANSWGDIDPSVYIDSNGQAYILGEPRPLLYNGTFNQISSGLKSGVYRLKTSCGKYNYTLKLFVE